MKKLGKETLERALTLLAEKLEFDGAAPVSLITKEMLRELGHEDIANQL